MPSLYEKIEELIRSHVYLGKQSATGFELVKCQICNDYKERGVSTPFGKTSEQNITMLPLSRYSTIPAQLTFPESIGSLSAP
jgi:hypothetical protein